MFKFQLKAIVVFLMYIFCFNFQIGRNKVPVHEIKNIPRNIVQLLVSFLFYIK